MDVGVSRKKCGQLTVMAVKIATRVMGCHGVTSLREGLRKEIFPQLVVDDGMV